MVEGDQNFALEAERLKYEAAFDMMARAMRLKEPQISGEELKRNDCIAAQIEEVLRSMEVIDENQALTMRALIMGRIENILLEPKEHIPRSMLDIRSLGLLNDKEIARYLKGHGVDLAKPRDAFYLLEMIVESITYLRDHLLKPPDELHVNLKHILQKLESALEVLDSTRRDLVSKHGVSEDEVYENHMLQEKLAITHFEPEVYNLFKFSSRSGPCEDMQRRVLAQQACGVLRSMAAINFMDRHPLKPYVDDADTRLKEIVDENVKDQDKQGRVKGWLCRIPLAESINHLKTRKRTKGKLLRSAKYGLEIPRDSVGHLWVTKKKSELLRLIFRLYFDPDTAVFESSSILIEETKNRLFDPKVLKGLFGDYDKAYKFFVEGVDPKELGLNIDDDVEGTNGAHGGYNPHTSESYRAVHVTSYIAVVGSRDGKIVQFPVEKQYTDAESHRVNEKTHPGYAANQDEQERERVLSNNAGYLNYPQEPEEVVEEDQFSVISDKI